MKRKLWRIIPKMEYHRWEKDDVCWKRWFYINRLWSGRLIFISIKRHQLCLDFRYNWLADMMEGEKYDTR